MRVLYLIFTILLTISADDKLETICMKCQIPVFWDKISKNLVCRLLKILPIVLSVKTVAAALTTQTLIKMVKLR